jgi:hypothetical protein
MSLLDQYLTEDELVKELQAKAGFGCIRTLRKWREQRIGPPWANLGPKVIVYPNHGFQEWLHDQIVQPVRSRKRAANL